MKIDDLKIWEAFYSVAKYGNFSKAAKQLRIPLPQVSKRVAKLEEHLQTKLFRRSTRVVNLTDEGKALLPRVSTFLDELSSMEGLFEQKKDNLSGTIRITCVPFLAQRLLIPVFEEFVRMNPEVHIELELSETLTSLVDSNFDIAIRIHNEPPDSALIYRKLAPNNLIACASPRYLKLHQKSLNKPKDLLQLDVLSLKAHRNIKFANSEIKLGDLKSKITCDNGWFLTQAALHDFGVLIRSQWDVQDHLKNKELVQVLKNYPLGSFGNIYAVTSGKKFLTQRVLSFLEHLMAQTRKWPTAERESE